MDDPGWTWPFWKFGLKRDDLFTKLHDQYNTFPSSIQDPEAFHHDVFEISTEASTTDEFHRLMAERKQRRLNELNGFLESASVEIIANPALIGTEQWQHALQLFRTRSLDSLVRYFASYLPDHHPWHRPDLSATSSYDVASVECIPYPDQPFLDSHHDSCDIQHDVEEPTHHRRFPLSPRSMTTCSDSSVASPVDLDDHDSISTPARSMSFSESEPDHFPVKDDYPSLHDVKSCDAETAVSSAPNMSESHRKEATPEEQHEVIIIEEETRQKEAASDDSHNVIVIEDDDDQLINERTCDTFESETPTPRADDAALAVGGSLFFATKPSPVSSLHRPRQRSLSPTRIHLPSHTSTTSPADIRKLQSSPRSRRLDHSPVVRGRRSGSSRDVANTSSRILKPKPDLSRLRPSGRRRKCTDDDDDL